MTLVRQSADKPHQHLALPLTTNWYSAWLPVSLAVNRKPVLSTARLTQTGSESKYFTLSSVTVSPSYTRVAL